MLWLFLLDPTTRKEFIPVIRHLNVNATGQGLHSFTNQVRELVHASGLQEGLCTLFIQHTSASLLIQEDYDSSARIDLENWLNRLVPENDALYTHTLEGADDMPAHIKAALTATQLSIPFENTELLLGNWQGIFLWEHRHHAGTRRIIAHLG